MHLLFVQLLAYTRIVPFNAATKRNANNLIKIALSKQRLKHSYAPTHSQL